MISPEDDAARLFNKWKREKCAIKLLLACEAGGGSLAGFIADVEWPTIRIMCADPVSELSFDLRSASFEYAEESPAGDMEDDVAEYPAVLLASFPSGLRLGFFEFEEGINNP